MIKVIIKDLNRLFYSTTKCYGKKPFPIFVSKVSVVKMSRCTERILAKNQLLPSSKILKTRFLGKIQKLT